MSAPRPEARRRRRRGRVRGLTIAPIVLAALATFDLIGIVVGPGGPEVCPGSGPALVLGAAQYDGRPSPAFERRLASALEAYRAGCVDRIVVSGGSRPGDRTSEGEAGVAWLATHGVPLDALTAEAHATNTAENVRLSLPALAGGTVLLVTDDLHGWRALLTARRHELRAQVRTVPAGGDRGGYLLREWAAVTATRLGLAP